MNTKKVMNKCLLSVIVPVYNIENYIERCVKSIMGASYAELDIILVDDGSTDNSGNICDEFARVDHRIRVIHKENGGLVSARKAGVQIANGKYATFVDGDDFIDNGLYELAMKSMLVSETDMLCFGYQKCDEEGETERIVKNRLKDGIYHTGQVDSYLENELLRFVHAAWNKVYVTEILRIAISRVDNSVVKGEDLNLTLAYLLDCDSFYIDNSIHGYNYVDRSSSITHVYDPNSIERMSNYIKSSLRLVTSTENDNKQWKRLIYHEIYYLIMQNCIGCTIAYFGKSRIISILYYFRRLCNNDVIRTFFDNGVKLGYFDGQKMKFAILMARKKYISAFYMRATKQIC